MVPTVGAGSCVVAGGWFRRLRTWWVAFRLNDSGAGGVRDASPPPAADRRRPCGGPLGVKGAEPGKLWAMSAAATARGPEVSGRPLTPMRADQSTPRFRSGPDPCCDVTRRPLVVSPTRQTDQVGQAERLSTRVRVVVSAGCASTCGVSEVVGRGVAAFTGDSVLNASVMCRSSRSAVWMADSIERSHLSRVVGRSPWSTSMEPRSSSTCSVRRV